jgi:hypothetical protein
MQNYIEELVYLQSGIQEFGRFHQEIAFIMRQSLLFHVFLSIPPLEEHTGCQMAGQHVFTEAEVLELDIPRRCCPSAGSPSRRCSSHHRLQAQVPHKKAGSLVRTCGITS